MYILAVASQKGGSGKTTLTGHLAVEAERQGMGPVAMIDTDPQGSLTDWWNVREAETPLFVNSSVPYLSEDLAKLKEAGIKLVIIDTPPAITTSIQSVVNQVDLVVIPTRPSPHDLRAAGATVDLAERSEKALIFVINAAAPRARLTTEAAIALSQHGAVAPVVIHNRQDFAASMTDGRTVMEITPSSKANIKSTGEISALWAYIAERLRSVALKPLFKPAAQRVAFGKRRHSSQGFHAPAVAAQPRAVQVSEAVPTHSGHKSQERVN